MGREVTQLETIYEKKRSTLMDLKKSILQKETRMPERSEYLICNRRGAEIMTIGDRRPAHTKTSRRR